MNTKLMWESINAFRSGAPFGDVVLLKLAALRKSAPRLNALLGKVTGYAPALSFEALDALPANSMGSAYAAFLRDNGLEHLTVSPVMLERFADDPFAVRYTVTHDLHHLLTGFDTGLAGEAGVVAFTVGQGTAPISDGMFKALRWIYPMFSPSQRSEILHNLEHGRRMGERAELLLSMPLESWLDRPLDEIRQRVGIDAADIAAIRPSGRSWLVERIYGSVNRQGVAA